MRIGYLSLFLLFTALAMPGLAQKSTSGAKQKRKTTVKKTSSNVTCCYPLNVTELRLSHVEIAETCAEGTSCSSESRIKVATVAVQPDERPNKYVYKVSAGKIEGDSANVVWDLSGVPPGEYTITAGVDMGPPWGVLGTTWTKMVRIVDCLTCTGTTKKEEKDNR